MTNRLFYYFLIIFISLNSLLYAQEQNNASEKEVSEKTINIEESFMIPETADTGTAETGNINTQNNRLVTFTVWDFLRMFLVLLFIGAAIYGLIFLLKKASTGKYDESDLINIISSKSVSAGKTLHIVEVGNQMMLLGVSDDSINHLADITDKETYERIKLYKGENEAPKSGSFYSYLSDVINPGRKKGKKTGNISSLLEKQKKRMEKL